MKLLSYIRRRSLQTKSFLALGLIGALSILGMLLGFLSARTVAHEYQSMLSSNTRFELLITRVMARMNQLSRDEYAYVTTRDDKLLKHREHTLQHIFQAISELSKTTQTLVPTSEIQDFENRIKSHQEYFKIMAQRMVDEGNAETGYLGELRKAAHSAEKILKSNKSVDQLRIMVSYLSIRRHEKDYLARREFKYIERLDAEIADLKSVLSKSPYFSKADREAILEAAETYRRILQKMHVGYEDLVVQRSKQDEGLTYIDDFITSLSEKVRTDNASRQAGLDRLVLLVNWIFILAAAATLVIILVSLREFSSLTRSLTMLAASLGQSGERNLKTSLTLHTASEKSSAAAAEQASAIQETVSSINEISAMVERSVGIANSSAEKADLSYQISMEGKQVMSAMRDSMIKIRETMSEMVEQNVQGSQRMQAILAVIEKIVERTHVINDIVFQTRLLAFNASVEAARAGEHGKGFSVVAEEVGNLARMSGEASKAIAGLLQESRKEVMSIIMESKQQTDRITQSGVEKVEAGVQIAYRCDEILSEIVEHVGFVKKLMTEISVAAKEESNGIQNITIAMNELDDTTAVGSDMAHQTMSISNMLNQEAATLNGSVDLLSRIVLGDAQAENQTRSSETDPNDPGAPELPMRMAA